MEVGGALGWGEIWGCVGLDSPRPLYPALGSTSGWLVAWSLELAAWSSTEPPGKSEKKRQAFPDRKGKCHISLLSQCSHCRVPFPYSRSGRRALRAKGHRAGEGAA